MHTRIKLTVPQDAIASLTLTMTIKEFKEFRGQLVDKWPTWKVGEAIQEAISKAEKEIWGPDDE
jgi:hypothetical protein